MSEPVRFVWLRGGRPVPVAAVEVVLDLERRGICFSQDGPDLLLQGSDLTDADLDAVRPHKHHIIALLNYTPDDRHITGRTSAPSTTLRQRERTT
ncbi:MAG: hypothetical protein AB7O67_01970 [Vicinamibacterales bacterium]